MFKFEGLDDIRNIICNDLDNLVGFTTAEFSSDVLEIYYDDWYIYLYPDRLEIVVCGYEVVGGCDYINYSTDVLRGFVNKVLDIVNGLP